MRTNGAAGPPQALRGDKLRCWDPLHVTFGGACSPQVVDGGQDEPAGFLFIWGDAQHLHGSLQLTELLSRLLLLLRLQGQTGTLAPHLGGAVPAGIPPCCWALREGEARESRPARARILLLPGGAPGRLKRPLLPRPRTANPGPTGPSPWPVAQSQTHCSLPSGSSGALS